MRPDDGLVRGPFLGDKVGAGGSAVQEHPDEDATPGLAQSAFHAVSLRSEGLGQIVLQQQEIVPEIELEFDGRFVRQRAAADVIDGGLGDDGDSVSGELDPPAEVDFLRWGMALVLAELNPERQDTLLKAGYEWGQSRVIAGYHWQSDVDASNLLSSAVFARLQSCPEYQQDVAAAREELAALAAQRRLTGKPKPEEHHLVPDRKAVKESPYKGHKNYGKTIAVFGGSLSVNKESDAAKQQWADLLNAEVTTYGVGGAGFSSLQGYTLQKQVEEAGVYDVYVLWASTNDYTNSRECGTWKDYTALDGYDKSKLTTQCGGINYCIKTLLEKNPKAEIYFFTSLRFFGADAGHNPFSVQPNKTGKTFADYIDGQKACCAYYGIPVLDQFSLQGVNEFNVDLFYLQDKLHMNEDGYRRIGPVQASFLADGR